MKYVWYDLMEDGEADRDPGCDCDTPPGPRDLGLPDLSGVPVGRPPPGPSWSEFLRGRAEIKVSVIINKQKCDNKELLRIRGQSRSTG